MVRFIRRVVKLATFAGVIGAAVAAYQQSRSTATTTPAPASSGDAWPEVPRRPAE